MDSQTLDTLFTQLWKDFVAFFPFLVTALLLLLVGYLIGRFLHVLIRRLLQRIGVDKIVERAGLADGMTQAGISRPISDLTGQLAFWLVFLSFIIVILDYLGLDAIVLPLQRLLGYLPHLLAAALVLVVGAFLAQFLGRTVQASAAGLGIDFHQTLGKVIRGFILVVAVLVAVEQLGLDIDLLATSLINIVTIVVAGLVFTLALGAHSFAKNILAGYYAREIYSLGDHVRIDEHEGRLEAIGPLNAEIHVTEGRLIVPNARLIEGQVWFRGVPDRVDRVD
jgi:hypothetical protein